MDAIATFLYRATGRDLDDVTVQTTVILCGIGLFVLLLFLAYDLDLCPKFFCQREPAGRQSVALQSELHKPAAGLASLPVVSQSPPEGSWRPQIKLGPFPFPKKPGSSKTTPRSSPSSMR